MGQAWDLFEMIILVPESDATSEYAESRRPWVKLALLLQSLLCVARVVLFVDIPGAFMMAIGVVIGCLGIQVDINMPMLCAWGILCLITGFGDLIRLIDASIQNEIPLFSWQASTEENLLSGILLAGPASSLLGVPLAWWLCEDCISDPLSFSERSLLVLPGARRSGSGTTTFTGRRWRLE